MSDRNRNKLPNNLPQLQNLVKRDPDSYKEEVSVWSGACIWQHSELSGTYTCSVFIVIIIIRSSLLGIPWHAPSTFLCLPLQLVVLQVCILCHPSIGQCRSFLGVLSPDVHVLASRVIHPLLVLLYCANNALEISSFVAVAIYWLAGCGRRALSLWSLHDLFKVWFPYLVQFI